MFVSVAKLAEFQQEVREARRSAKEATAERDVFESKYNDLADSMEVAVLDKEMAEEKAENLQHEVSMLKEKVDEMHVDLDVLQHDDGKDLSPPLWGDDNDFVDKISHAVHAPGRARVCVCVCVCVNVSQSNKDCMVLTNFSFLYCFWFVLSGNTGNPSVSQVQLERQIERLREALFK